MRLLDTTLTSTWSTSASPAFVDVPGPGGGFNWNLTPSCFAKAPALQLTGSGRQDRAVFQEL